MPVNLTFYVAEPANQKCNTITDHRQVRSDMPSKEFFELYLFDYFFINSFVGTLLASCEVCLGQSESSQHVPDVFRQDEEKPKTRVQETGHIFGSQPHR